MNKKAEGISITLDMESGKMQRQLRAIAKHTEALADELNGIDKEVCPKCGSSDVEVERALAFNGKVHERVTTECFSCGYGK